MPSSHLTSPRALIARARGKTLTPRFPPEVVDHIVVCLLSTRGAAPARFSDVAAFSLASFHFRETAFRHFFYLLDVSNKTGWLTMCTIPGIFDWVRILHAPTSAICQSGVTELQNFTRLDAVHIDFSTEGSNTHHTRAKLILMNLRLTQVKNKFRWGALRRLEFSFLPSVTPYLLGLVAENCPALESLKLACANRLVADCCWTCYEEASSCTVHSPLPDNFCVVDDLTRAFGSALSPLTRLRDLHLGIHLSPIEFFDDHLEHGQFFDTYSGPFAFNEHAPYAPQLCVACQSEQDVHAETAEAEERAARGLAEWLGALERVTWATWCVTDAGDTREDVEFIGSSPQTVSVLYVRRNEGAGRIDVRRKPW